MIITEDSTVVFIPLPISTPTAHISHPRLPVHATYLWIRTSLPQAGVNRRLIDTVESSSPRARHEIACLVGGVDEAYTERGNLNSLELAKTSEECQGYASDVARGLMRGDGQTDVTVAGLKKLRGPMSFQHQPEPFNLHSLHLGLQTQLLLSEFWKSRSQ